MGGMPVRALLVCLLGAATVASCALTRPPPPFAPPAPGTGPPAAPSRRRASRPPAQRRPRPCRPSIRRLPPRQFHLSAASTALVAQAHTQAAGGDYGQAAATLERALRIEPDNPLLWIELGRVRLGENNPSQADALGRKALSLATGDAARRPRPGT